jgi:hypothetical protein
MFGSYINRCNHIKDITNFVNLTFPIVSSVEKPEDSQHKLPKGTRIESPAGTRYVVNRGVQYNSTQTHIKYMTNFVNLRRLIGRMDKQQENRSDD